MAKIIVFNNVPFCDIDIGNRKPKTFEISTRFVVTRVAAGCVWIKKAGRGNNTEFECNAKFLSCYPCLGMHKKNLTEMSVLEFISWEILR